MNGDQFKVFFQTEMYESLVAHNTMHSFTVNFKIKNNHQFKTSPPNMRWKHPFPE